jgi:hypothetical protein
MKSWALVVDIARLGDGNYAAPTSPNLDTILRLQFTRSAAAQLKIVPR